LRTHYCFGRTRQGELTQADIQALILEGKTKQAALRAVPIEAVVLLLEQAGKLWGNPAYEPRQRVLEVLPSQIGFSREMVELELSGLTMALSRPYLEKKLMGELGRLDALDIFHRRAGGELFQKALPWGLVLHVASGNVSTVGVLSLIEGLLSRNVNLLKVASNAPLLPLLFAETLKHLDQEGTLANSIAVIGWSGEKTPHHRLFQEQADAIVVWGGEDVVAIYRAGLAPSVKLIAYGPKVSAGLIGAESLATSQVEETARKVARDIALWDQNACSSPQLIYVEDQGVPALVDRFVAALTPALQAVGRELPKGALGLQEQAEITKEREIALIDELMGLGKLIMPEGDSQEWTIIIEKDPAFKLSPLGRTITLKPVKRLEEAVLELIPYRAHLQTVGLSVAQGRIGPLTEAIFDAGALRVTRLGEMSGGSPGEAHDGLFGLGELVKWVSLDSQEARQNFDGTIFLSREREEAISLAKRRLLLESTCLNAPLYRERFGPRTLKREADWHALPLLTKADLAANTPPLGNGLLTQVPPDGHWLRTGGSTGAPKLSIYTFEDYEDDMWRAARGAHAAGLRRGEKVANLFYSGDLYGSFLSLNRTLELIGCNSFPFTNNAPVESVLTCLKQFGIETLIGVSSFVQGVLQEALKDPSNLKLKHVLYTGEHFHEKDRQKLKAGLGIERVTSIGYGAVDAGPMAYQCESCTGAIHHIHGDHVYLELIDPASGLPVGRGEVGEVVVTNLNRRLMPLIRYRIGDLGRWVDGPCPCGRSNARFELLGRAEERFHLGSASFHYHEVQAVFDDFSRLNASPQIVLQKTVPGIAIHAELLEAGDGRDTLAKQLRERLEARIGAIARAEGALAVEVLPPGGLERAHTGKFLRIVDNRLRP
jgi:phenylacetate-CoA ligase